MTMTFYQFLTFFFLSNYVLSQFLRLKIIKGPVNLLPSALPGQLETSLNKDFSVIGNKDPDKIPSIATFVQTNPFPESNTLESSEKNFQKEIEGITNSLFPAVFRQMMSEFPPNPSKQIFVRKRITMSPLRAPPLLDISPFVFPKINTSNEKIENSLEDRHSDNETMDKLAWKKFVPEELKNSLGNESFQISNKTGNDASTKNLEEVLAKIDSVLSKEFNNASLTSVKENYPEVLKSASLSTSSEGQGVKITEPTKQIDYKNTPDPSSVHNVLNIKPSIEKEGISFQSIVSKYKILIGISITLIILALVMLCQSDKAKTLDREGVFARFSNKDLNKDL